MKRSLLIGWVVLVVAAAAGCTSVANNSVAASPDFSEGHAAVEERPQQKP